METFLYDIVCAGCGCNRSSLAQPNVIFDESASYRPTPLKNNQPKSRKTEKRSQSSEKRSRSSEKRSQSSEKRSRSSEKKGKEGKGHKSLYANLNFVASLASKNSNKDAKEAKEAAKNLKREKYKHLPGMSSAREEDENKSSESVVQYDDSILLDERPTLVRFNEEASYQTPVKQGSEHSPARMSIESKPQEELRTSDLAKFDVGYARPGPAEVMEIDLEADEGEDGESDEDSDDESMFDKRQTSEPVGSLPSFSTKTTTEESCLRPAPIVELIQKRESMYSEQTTEQGPSNETEETTEPGPSVCTEQITEQIGTIPIIEPFENGPSFSTRQNTERSGKESIHEKSPITKPFGNVPSSETKQSSVPSLTKISLKETSIPVGPQDFIEPAGRSIIGVETKEDLEAYQKCVKLCTEYPEDWKVGAETDKTIFLYDVDPIEKKGIWIHAVIFLEGSTIADCAQGKNEEELWPDWHQTVVNIEKKGAESKLTKCLYAKNSIGMGLIKTDMNTRVKRYLHDGIFVETMLDELPDGDGYVPPQEGEDALNRTKSEMYSTYVPIENGILLYWHHFLSIGNALPSWGVDLALTSIVPGMVSGTLSLQHSVRSNQIYQKLRKEDKTGLYKLCDAQEARSSPLLSSWNDHNKMRAFFEPYLSMKFEEVCMC